MSLAGPGVDHARPQAAHRARQMSIIGEGRAGHLQRNPRGKWQWAREGQQSSPCAQVQSRGKFQEFLAMSVAPTDKNGDCQRQSVPIATLLCSKAASHSSPQDTVEKRVLLAPRLPNRRFGWGRCQVAERIAQLAPRMAMWQEFRGKSPNRLVPATGLELRKLFLFCDQRHAFCRLTEVNV